MKFKLLDILILSQCKRAVIHNIHYCRYERKMNNTRSESQGLIINCWLANYGIYNQSDNKKFSTGCLHTRLYKFT